MNLSIPVCDGRISPVFDVARRLLVVEIENGGEVSRREEPIQELHPMLRARHLDALGVNVLICGAISSPLERILVAAGMTVIPNTCGTAEDIIRSFVSGEFTDRSFLMPGCCRARRHRGGQRRGQKGRNQQGGRS
jgi:predicted Fe-Mo cluster-binding NifX family protein